MKAFGVATLLATLSPMGAYAGLCRPSSAFSSLTTASTESSTLATASTTLPTSTLPTTTSGESATSASETVSTFSTTESTGSSSAATDSTTVSTSLLSTTTSEAATTTTSAAPQGTEGPNGCCGYPGYFDGHVNALTALADSLTVDECTAMCTSDLACTWYIYYQLQDGRFQCNTYGTTPAFVVDETKTAIYYPANARPALSLSHLPLINRHAFPTFLAATRVHWMGRRYSFWDYARSQPQITAATSALQTQTALMHIVSMI
ncbi:hypothetical protein CEP52_010006 [Fusarium oligoseptatum]|uniref:Apple domain-containing protein n=1 Tax=Fusarium oligoseptatum TaxID=2604345 RepID=A0A428TAG2_9HYPO|nr:hypothetical protein CEP52_010006 [Fusarium oligoseptatum]